MIDPQLAEDTPAVTGRTLRQFSALSIIIFSGLAFWQGLVRHHVGPALILASLAIALGLVGLTWPERIRPLYSALVAVTYPIGRVVSLILLAGLFFGAFTVLGLLFRLFGRDALHIKPPKRGSHWTEKPAVTDLRSYVRQS